MGKLEEAIELRKAQAAAKEEEHKKKEQEEKELKQGFEKEFKRLDKEVFTPTWNQILKTFESKAGHHGHILTPVEYSKLNIPSPINSGIVINFGRPIFVWLECDLGSRLVTMRIKSEHRSADDVKKNFTIDKINANVIEDEVTEYYLKLTR